ncbi:uncharacterized protein LOC104931765 [Larimichthys crocea]|uniref:uncharacterized protein LOC104931765 n=1 Tax=Larimichthys crocea TaxID=215358 RepID=UPI0009008743|nr:uncharacterized protein LOC104931765 [Larimichthys crocea]
MAGNFAGNCLCNLLSASMFMAGCTILLVTAFPIAQITLGAVHMYDCPAAPFIPVYVMVCGMLALLLMGLFALPKLICPTAPGNMIWTVWIISLLLFVFIWFICGSYYIYSVYPPNYIKITLDPHSFNNSITKPSFIFIDQNQSLPNLNQTGMMSTDTTTPTTTNNNNQTLLDLIQTLAHSNISSETNREDPNTPQALHTAPAAAPYCDRTVYLFAFWTTTLVYAFGGNALVILVCIYGFMTIANKLTKYVF